MKTHNLTIDPYPKREGKLDSKMFADLKNRKAQSRLTSLLPFSYCLLPIAYRLLFLLACLVSLSGCWDLVEVDRRSFVTTMGIDIGNNGDTSVIVQLPLPERMLPSSVSSGSQQGKRFATTSITAKTANEALNILQSKTYRELVIEQNKSIIISEKFARLGIKSLLEYFIRNPKAPPQSLLFIAHHHTAGEVLSFTPIAQTLPGLEFTGASQSAVKYDRTYFISVGQFMPKSIHQATDAYAPLIDLEEKEGLFITAGLAVFDGFHLAGELDMDETQMYGLLSGLMQAGTLTLSLPDKEIVSLRNVRGKSAIKVRISQKSSLSRESTPSTEGEPSFLVKVNVAGALSDLVNSKKEIGPKDIRQLELAIQRVLETKLSAVIKKLQSYNSDIINFGEELRVQHQDVYKKLKWKQIFSTVSFKVVVKAKIERDGILR